MTPSERAGTQAREPLGHVDRGAHEEPLLHPLDDGGHEDAPVSYTHLTLPTSDLVYISVVAVSLKKKTHLKRYEPQEQPTH